MLEEEFERVLLEGGGKSEFEGKVLEGCWERSRGVLWGDEHQARQRQTSRKIITENATESWGVGELDSKDV